MFWALCGSLSFPFHRCVLTIRRNIMNSGVQRVRDTDLRHFLSGVARCSYLLRCLTNGWGTNRSLRSSVAVRIRKYLATHLFLTHNATRKASGSRSETPGSFETWCWRRMEKISGTDHVRNEEVLLKVKGQRNIVHEIGKRKASSISHILRRNCLLQ
jgi:hypothetical protein